MDPTTALKELKEAIEGADWITAIERLNDYYQWRLKGGFQPIINNDPGDQLADTLSTKLIDKLSEDH